MRRKGRLAAGAEADIVVFDSATITDQATYSASIRTTTGIRHVLVNGTFVVRDAQLVRDALTGRPVPRPAYTAQWSARPADCGPRRRGDAIALGAHSGSPTALIATSAKSLSARIGVAPYLPARYLRPIASSMRGLRSESAYSLLAPS